MEIWREMTSHSEFTAIISHMCISHSEMQHQAGGNMIGAVVKGGKGHCVLLKHQDTSNSPYTM
jgi:hypothetical protein